MTAETLASLHQALILDHAKKPRNRGALDDATGRGAVSNPYCGDEVRIWVRLDGDRIGAVGFEGRGCSISQASASILTGLVKGITVTEVGALSERFSELLQGDGEVAADRSLGDLMALQGVRRFPVRIRCALLAFDALRQAIEPAAESQGASAEGRKAEPGS